jgi:hypothetical protein
VPDNHDREKRRVVGFLGLGLDNKDGHKRLSQSEHFLLVGGSAETHERMQDTAIRFSEALRRHGNELQEMLLEEVLSILREEMER